MTTTHNPATMIAGTTREPSALAALDYLPRIDYATGIVLAGVLVIGAVLAARRMTCGILTLDKPAKPAQPLPVNNALKDAMAAALTDMAVARAQKRAEQAAAAAIAKARGIDGVEVHYVDAQFAPTAPAAFDAKRGAL